MTSARASAMTEEEVRFAADHYFGDALPQAKRYAEILATTGVERGLIGPGEASVLWERHMLNCAAIVELIPPDVHVCDVGSGAGLPGIVLGICRPDLRVECAEPLLRRATFLGEVVQELGLAQVNVLRSRAESLPRAQYDVVTARAVAPLARLVPLVAPLLKQSGLILALKGARAREELQAVHPKLSRLGVPSASVHFLGKQVLGTPTCVVRLARSAGRSEGIAARDAHRVSSSEPAGTPHAPDGRQE